MIWSALRSAAYWTIGAIQAAGELAGATRRLVRQARKGVVPHVDDSPPMPLSHLDAERQARAARNAGHEKG